MWHRGQLGWTAARLPSADRSLYDVACTSTSFCVISGSAHGVAGPGFLLVSTRPAAKVAAWKREAVPVGAPGAVACASRTPCVIGDSQTGKIAVGQP